MFFNWLRGMDLLCHLETFAVANRRPGVRLVSAVEPPSSVVQIQQHTKIKNTPLQGRFSFNWLRGMDLLCHLETFAVANRRPGVRLVSAVEPPSSVVQIQQHTKIKNTPLQGRFSFNWLRGMDLNH